MECWRLAGQRRRSTLGVLFVWLGLGPIGLIAGLCLGMLITLAQPLAAGWRQARLDLCDWVLLRRLTRYGAPLAVTAALSFMIAGSDRLLIGWLLGDRSVGLYAVGYDLANSSLGVLLMVVNLAAYPLAVRALEERGEAAARRQVAVESDCVACNRSAGFDRLCRSGTPHRRPPDRPAVSRRSGDADTSDRGGCAAAGH